MTAPDLVDELGLAKATAGKYIDLLIAHEGWEPVKAATKRGRPAKAAARALTA